MPDFTGSHTVHGDQINQKGPANIGKIVTHPEPSKPPPAKPRTVLMLASNPIDTQRLRLDEEHRAISQAIRAARYRDQIKLERASAPRYHDLHTLLHEHRPAVVHYAGHGNHSGIALLGGDGSARPVSPEALEELFSLVRDSVTCVVLNACLTSVQAAAIAKHVPCVVGVSLAVQDRVAIHFAAGFHAAIANGESVARAFEFGRNLPALAGLNSAGPQLFSANGAAERLRITGPAE